MLKNTFTHWINCCLLCLLWITPAVAQTITNVSTAPFICGNGQLTVSFDASGFDGNTTFTVQFSEPDGSFSESLEKRFNGTSSPITVNTSGPVGDQYRVRVFTSPTVGDTSSRIAIRAIPSPPEMIPFPPNTFCSGNPVVELTDYIKGDSLRWYKTTTLAVVVDPEYSQSYRYTPGNPAYHWKMKVSQTINGCESPTINFNLSATQPLRAPDLINGNNLIVCQGEEVGLEGDPYLYYNVPESGLGERLPIDFKIPTDQAKTYTYYRAKTERCENFGGYRDTITVTVQAPSASPVAASIELCPGSTAPDIATLVTAASGATLTWYAAATGAAIAKPTINTAAVGTHTYYVSQTEAGKCESARVALTVQIKAAASPTLPSTSVQYCIGSAADALPQQTGWKWYTTATGGTALAATFKPSTATAGTTSYYVENTDSGCVSTSRTKFDVQVINVTAPTLPQASVTYCLNAAASVLPQASNRVWYATQTGGTPLAATFKPSTATAGTTSYWAAAKTGNCESARVEYKVIVTSVEAPVLAETSTQYCVGTTAANVSVLPQATGRVWYTSATGGTALAATFKPSAATAGITSYWAANRTGTCESERVEYKVVVVATPAPIVANIQACAGEPLPALTATGENLKWYTAATGGTGSTTAPVPSNTATKTYYVTQTKNGCESPRAALKVTINPIPVKPTVKDLATVCQDVTVPSTALTSAVTKATGATLKWYTSLLDTVGVTTTPKISTAEDGLQEFVVSQTVLGCESPKSVIKLEVKALPANPVVTETIDYCHNEKGAIALTAEKSPTNNTLNWYTVATGGTATATAPVPPTNVVGTRNYYVSQVQTYTITGGTLKCESKRSNIKVVTNALPASPTTKDIEECQTKEATPITLTATHAAGNSLKWYDTNTATTALTGDPVIDQSKVLKKSYFVTQVSAKNCESAARKELKVNIKLLPGAPQVVTLDKCQFDTPEPLTAGTVTGASLKWWGSNATGGTASTTAPTPVFEKGESSTYYVSQTLEGCESDRAKLDVVVKTTPKPIVATNSFVYCQNETSSTLTAQGQRLTWYFGSLSGPDAFAPPTANIGTVSYYVAQTGDNGCISPKEEIKVTVNPKPSASITGTTKIELGQPAELVINFTGGGPWKYVLSDNTEGTTETTPLVITKSPQKTTTYSIKEVSNVCGLGTPNGSAFVEVLIPAINTGNPAVASICANQSFTIPFQASAINVDQYEYKLQISKDTLDKNFVSIPTTINRNDATGIIPDTTAGGDYFIRLIVESPYYDQPVKGTVSQVTLTVNPLPVATVSGSKTILVGESAVVQIDFSGAGPWHFTMGNSDELTTTSVTPYYKTVQPETTTTYTIKDVQNECGAGLVKGEARIQVDPILGNEPAIEGKDWVEVFPVPVAHNLTVKVKELFMSQNVRITVTDAAGRVVKQSALVSTISEVDFSQLSAGMYFIRIENGDLVAVNKVMKY